MASYAVKARRFATNRARPLTRRSSFPPPAAPTRWHYEEPFCPIRENLTRIYDYHYSVPIDDHGYDADTEDY